MRETRMTADKRWQLLCVLVGAWLIISAIALWLASSSLLHPKRSSVAPHLTSWLNSPDRHGMQISRETCAAGNLPCLLVAPHPSSALGERGKLIRRQLREQGYTFPETITPTGILLLLHGRNGRKENMLPIAERFTALGFYCVIPDLPAHGDSPLPNVHFGAGLHDAKWINQTLADARAHFSAPDLPASIWGISMGGAFANAAVSAQPENWHRMIIIASFDQLPAVIDDQLSWMPRLIRISYRHALRKLLLFRGGVDMNTVRPDQWATTIPIPTLVIHGNQDRMIKPARGKALFNHYANPAKHWLSIPDGHHQNILITNHPTYATMGRWLLDANLDIPL